ncbi:MAG: DNA primase [Acidimicrobiales bacterium]
MGIVDEDVQRVRDAVNIREIISQYVQLKQVGRRWVGLCPFHAEKSGSFSVNEADGFWYCHGACHRGGDTIGFIRDIEHLDFPGSVEHLAGKLGITLRYTERGEDEGRKRRHQLVEAMRKAVEWYHDRLLTADDAGPARSYLRSRGLGGEIVRQYQIGWAPDSWDAMVRALRLPSEVAVDTGLAFLNRSGRLTDAFRGRVLFPILDVNGDPVAFGGRILPGADGPKYKNSPESAIYKKSQILYGLSWAKTEIVHADEAIVCEGYTDVIGFAQAELGRAVATCGTALTEEHLRIIGKFSHHVVLAFDADTAGQNAAARIYEWEQKLKLSVTVAALPAGVDPGELAQTDPQRLREAVESSVPFLGFRVHRVLDAARLDAPEQRAAAAEAALEVIREHPSELVRDQYVMEVADRCRIEADQLRARLRRPGAVRVLEDRGTRRQADRDSAEVEALRHLIHSPDAIDPLLLVDPASSEVLFTDERNLAAFRVLASHDSVHAAIDAADPGAAELILRLAVDETDSDPEDVVALLVRSAALRELGVVEARARSDGTVMALESKLLLEQLVEPTTRRTAIDQLLLWLGSRSEHETLQHVMGSGEPAHGE